MYDLIQAIPDAEVLIALEPEELGAKLLFLLRKRSAGTTFLFENLLHELWTHPPLPGQPPPYPRERQYAIDLALSEAWAWLEAQGLLVPPADSNARAGWRLLSRRARRFENEAEFAQYAVARMFPKQALDERISGTVWMAFMRGEFDVAAFQAMKAVEVAVRDAGGFGNNLIGVPLMREAFAPDKGPKLFCWLITSCGSWRYV